MLGKPAQLLGISLGERHAAAIVMERSGSGVRVAKERAFTMSLDLLKDDAELVGRELRGHLDDAGIACRHCIVCVPVKWLLATEVVLPDLDEEDAASFLELQAERNLPLPASEMMIASSQFRASEEATCVTILALPTSHLLRLQKALSAANLRPESVTIAVAALAGNSVSDETVALSLGKHSVEMAVRAGGGLVSLRAFDDVLEEEGNETVLRVDALCREVRITLNRLPNPRRSALDTVEIHGPAQETDPVVEEVRAELALLGLSVRLSDSAGERQTAGVAPGLAAATAQRLAGRPNELEFLPAAPSRLKQWAAPILKRRAASLLCVGAAVILVATGALWLQGRKLAALEGQWADLEPAAEEAALLQDRIRLYRPWFDASSPTLDAMADLTAAFPEEGTVWLRSLTIKNQSRVACSGSAETSRAWLAMLSALKATPGIVDLQVSQVRGDDPVEFSFSYGMGKGSSHE